MLKKDRNFINRFQKVLLVKLTSAGKMFEPRLKREWLTFSKITKTEKKKYIQTH